VKEEDGGGGRRREVEWGGEMRMGWTRGWKGRGEKWGGKRRSEEERKNWIGKEGTSGEIRKKDEG